MVQDANASSLPLAGLVVLEFAQFLAGPSAGLKLADLGATVIKIERPKTGEAGRQIAIKNLFIDGDSLVFHTINRNKQSIAADLKNPDDLAAVKKLIAQADVLTHNFRPGVMEKLGLDYAKVQSLNPSLIYGEVTGYGSDGPWRDKPGQDLLVQCVSGLTWLTGNADQGPVPMGLSVADTFCGIHFAQGILAAVVRRARTNQGALVQVSLLESALDLQFEVITTYLADGGHAPKRGERYNAHAYLSAPYGIYPTADAHLTLAMGDLVRIGEVIDCAAVAKYADRHQWFAHRDELQRALAEHLKSRTTGEWLQLLRSHNVWCSEVLDYEGLVAHDGFKTLRIDQVVHRDDVAIRTTRSPIQIDGQILLSDVAAPRRSETLRVPSPLYAGERVRARGVSGTVSNSQREPLTLSPEDRGEGAGLPLSGITVLDFSQFLSGPCASLKLADLGARVIKIEKPFQGDICRELYVSDQRLDSDSTVFHAINRNKESFVADLKSPDGLAAVRKLIERADVVMHNFRPGVMERLGLNYSAVKSINPGIIFGQINGYGTSGPWRDLPGQDLLVQSLSGLTWLSGNAGQGPVPMGLSVCDMICGMHLATGILACLVRRANSGVGALVECSLLESTIDLQFETLTTFFNDGGATVARTASNNANAYLGAPYGIYATSDGHLGLAMGRIPQLGELLGCAPLLQYQTPASAFDQRDVIKNIIADHLRTDTTAHWLSKLEPADIWCAEVFDWKRLFAHDAFNALEMFQTVRRGTGSTYRTTRCPIRLDGKRLFSNLGSPDLGEHTDRITGEMIR